MKTIIVDKLKEIEKANNIKIVFACESGSRAWGFPSTDSDFDVRFVYVRNVEDYLSVRDVKDHLSFPITDELDVYGWDLKKILVLMLKSNTTIFEWLQSPEIYYEDKTFREVLWQLSQHFFSRRSNTFHYLGIAKSALAALEENNEIKIKKLFYVLRPLLAAQWCLEKEKIAPMTMTDLLEILPKNDQVKTAIAELIQYKETTKEEDRIVVGRELREFIHTTFERIAETGKSLGKDTFEAEMLDTFFQKTIQHYDDKRNKGERTVAV